MPRGLLASQLASLQKHAGVLAVDVTSHPAESVAAIRRGLGV
jgi:hypothetical protein